MRRAWYAIALAAAVVTLVGSMALTMSHFGRFARGDRADGRSGFAMMGQTTARDAPSGDATALAKAWIAANAPGVSLGSAVDMPMATAFTLKRNNQSVGILMVNERTGAVVAHLDAGAN